MPDSLGHFSTRGGLAVLKDIRANHPTVKTIMLTAGSDDLTAAETIKSGAHDYIKKGTYSNQEILELVADLLTISDGALNSDSSTLSARFARWIRTRTEGVIDELIATLIVAGTLFVLGRSVGILEGLPLEWLHRPWAVLYVMVGVAFTAVVVTMYVILQQRQRREK